MGEKKETFGEILRKLREDRGLTLRQVEEKAKVSNAYLSQVERGERGIPSIRILTRLAEVYGTSILTLTQKAEDTIKHKNHNTGETKIPAPDTNFICRGYENLSEENKQALKKFLHHLESMDKGKK